ncbi:MAG: response regulator [Cyanophyceae cyanobacterium]
MPPSAILARQDWELVYYGLDELEALLEQTPQTWFASFDELEASLAGDSSEQANFLESLGSPLEALPDSERQLLDEGTTELQKLLEEASQVTPQPQSASSQPLATAFEQTMRVPVKQLDTLNNLIGELVVNRNTLEQDHGRLRQFLDSLLHYVQGLSDIGGRMQELYERSLLEGALLASRHGERNDWSEPSASSSDRSLNALEMDRFTGFHTLSQEMIELIVRVRESASDIQFLVDNTEQVSLSLQQITSQLQEGLNKARMVPFSQTADRLPRAVREISRRLNKQAQLKVEGRDVLIDKMLLEQLYDPMTHLVNNAITHGIESPEERQQQGKPLCGQVTVSAFLQGNQTIISIADDGAGIDSRKVKAKALEKGLLSPAKAKALAHQDCYEFLFHPGFSTKDKADDFAGRGVGMDVVRTSLEAIRGKIGIDSTLGKGTTFTVRLPLTLSICKALCCLSNQFRIAFPMDGVEDMQDYAASDIQTDAEGQPCVPWRNTLLPFRSLKELLSYRRSVGRRMRGTQSEDTVSIVVLRGAGTLLAVEVERVLGEQEIVIKQIEGPIPKPLGIAGATVLGDGSVMAIGDVLELIEIAQGNHSLEGQLWQKTIIYAQPEAIVDQKPAVLIVDDSITVRELLSISFSNAGYRVEQARDGSEAWEKLRSGLACDIIFCDVEMPRMNGLELLSCLQKDERLASIPVALLTSRGAARHRQVAVELGARGYFTKPYTEKDLLDAAQKMIAGEVLVSGSPRSKSTADKPPEDAEPPAEPTVLIVDDSVMVREMLSMTFKKAGYQVEQARDGQDALEKLRSSLPIDLVFCDIEMPRMNGLDLLARLQQDPTLSQLPVAMITSRGAERHRNIAQERGAKGYFTKPYIEKTLLEAAKELLKGENLMAQAAD